MQTKLLSWILLCGLVTVFALSARAQQAQVAGRIVAARVKGTVTATNTVDNTKRDLHDNDAITEKYVVTTGGNSSVILVFSNGATINLAHDSTLSIEQFLQDPFSTSYSMATASSEPSTSTTKLSLSRGELVGNVKHLNQSGGSNFLINTPVGAAGIRGTTFRIVFRPESSNKAFFSLSTTEGEVILTGTAQTVPVASGKRVEVNVDITIDPVTGAITVTSIPNFRRNDISAAEQVLIAAAAQEILATHTDLVFTSSTTSTHTHEDLVTPNGNTPPSVQQPQEQTTPGDGK